MFTLTTKEWESLRSQFVTSKTGRGDCWHSFSEQAPGLYFFRVGRNYLREDSIVFRTAPIFWKGTVVFLKLAPNLFKQAKILKSLTKNFYWKAKNYQ
jgi:hypothetical protein